MGVSYELSRREGRIGGPEKPLSELGRRGYLRFWAARVARAVLDRPRGKVVTVKQIADDTWMVVEDVVAALKEMGVLERGRGGKGLVVKKGRVREWVREHEGDVEAAEFVGTEGFVEG